MEQTPKASKKPSPKKPEPGASPSLPPPTKPDPTIDTKIATDQRRIKVALLRLREQANPRMLDRFLDCLTPATAKPDRIPVAVTRKVMSTNRLMHIHNLCGEACLAWGAMCDTKQAAPNPALDRLEQVAAKGISAFAAYPEASGSPFYTLRTVEEERERRLKEAK